jgi:hypothetical protein
MRVLLSACLASLMCTVSSNEHKQKLTSERREADSSVHILIVHELRRCLNCYECGIIVRIGEQSQCVSQ